MPEIKMKDQVKKESTTTTIMLMVWYVSEADIQLSRQKMTGFGEQRHFGPG